MKDILLFIDSLPLILSHICYGAIFIAIFKFISFSKSKKDFKLKFISCITANFFIIIFFNIICEGISHIFKVNIDTNSTWSYFYKFIFTVLTAWILGIIVRNKKFNNILLRLGIKRTTNTNIWNDIIKDYTWLNIQLKDKDYSYYGEVHFIEENVSNPKVVLGRYKLMKMSTAETIADYSDNPNKTIMIDTSNIDIIEIVYK